MQGILNTVCKNAFPQLYLLISLRRPNYFTNSVDKTEHLFHGGAGLAQW